MLGFAALNPTCDDVVMTNGAYAISEASQGGVSGTNPNKK